jgi:effector-binding domain-containing protein
MEYQVHVQQVASQLTAVVRRRAKQTELAIVVPQACGEVWSFIRSSPLLHPGRNLALYLDGEINLEVGVEVSQSFEGNGHVFCSRTPAGTVVTTAHFGPYNRLHEAHNALCTWCRKNGHAVPGINWEVYGHWNDDPAKLRTDVFFLLQAAGSESAG